MKTIIISHDASDSAMGFSEPEHFTMYNFPASLDTYEAMLQDAILKIYPDAGITIDRHGHGYFVDDEQDTYEADYVRAIAANVFQSFDWLVKK